MQVEGRVVRIMGKQHVVWDGKKDVLSFPGGRLDLGRGRSKNRVAVGDRVVIRPESDGSALIERILPRENALSRRLSFTGAEHVIAANVDNVAVVLSPEPRLNTRLLDRYLVEAHASGIPPLILVNKMDLVSPGADLPALAVYRALEYRVHLASAKLGEGLDAFLGDVAGSWTVLVGHSGVGKTTLVNRVVPGTKGAVGVVNPATGRGRHTTASATAHRLAEETVLIDTAGIREFGLWGMDWRCVEGGFPEIHALGAGCRFPDCRHLEEPHCAVREALGEEGVSPERYASYRVLLKEVEERV